MRLESFPSNSHFTAFRSDPDAAVAWSNVSLEFCGGAVVIKK
jgi:hypothetical protein